MSFLKLSRNSAIGILSLVVIIGAMVGLLIIAEAYIQGRIFMPTWSGNISDLNNWSSRDISRLYTSKKCNDFNSLDGATIRSLPDEYQALFQQCQGILAVWDEKRKEEVLKRVIKDLKPNG